jgi:hypothetical protein
MPDATTTSASRIQPKIFAAIFVFERGGGGGCR